MALLVLPGAVVVASGAGIPIPLSLMAFTELGWWMLRNRRAASAAPVGVISGPRSFSFEVVGESHYQEALAQIAAERARTGAEHFTKAALVLGDTNRHDSKAVRVDIDGRTVGNLPRPLACEYRARLQQLATPNLQGVCDAVIRGGWDRGSRGSGQFGVRLDLPTSWRLKAALTPKWRR